MTLLMWIGALLLALWAAMGIVAWANAAGARDEYRDMRRHDALNRAFEDMTRELDR